MEVQAQPGTWLITGCSTGLGRALAEAVLAAGQNAVVTARDAGKVADLATNNSDRVLPLALDVTDSTQVTDAVSQAEEKFGHIDVLVNNAAHQMTVDGIADVSTELLDRTFKTNIYAMFWLVKAALPHMPEGGSIINVASIQAYQPSPTLLPYSSTKGAIVTFTKGLAQEVVQYGLRANTVAPGPVWTPIIPASMPGDTVSSFGGTSPMGRPAQPAELAPAFVFLASQEASYVNGETLGVTGGQPLP
jgi:NAD(P)-dependent dehydrogenase (short-subunit alcohol dehydrogenase family)